jgi:DNA-binding helix-hairpin-helix protein with protein kinase domain
MEGSLKTGSAVKSTAGKYYAVKKFLGTGGGGEVYQVESGGSRYALKWYFKQAATENQREILENLIVSGAPDDNFLWPIDLISPSPEELGCVTPLLPSSYKGFADLVAGNAQMSFRNRSRAAFNITKGFQNLHRMGFCCQSITFSNVFFDPDIGNILIGDNDNVVPQGVGKVSILGTPRFMAPEMVRGEAEPSVNTDLFSLAVLLFYMFMFHHPLEGKKEAAIKIFDDPTVKKFFGAEPVFVYDPNDDSNRPVPGYQDAVITYWPIYPARLQKLFIDSFTIGLKDPARRVTEKQWLDALVNLIFDVFKCPACGAEVFFDGEKAEKGAAHTCWNCKKQVPEPKSFVIGSDRIPLLPGTLLPSHYITGNYDISSFAGTVIQNPNNPQILGLRNDTQSNWTYIKTDGTQVPVPPGKSAMIAKTAKVNFGQKTGEFQ